MDEPVADMVRGTLDGHVVLDREIAERGRFPAIDLRRSVSRSAPMAWSEREAALVARARALIARFEEAEPMIQAGLYSLGTDPGIDEAIALWPALDRFVGTSAEGESDLESFARLGDILGSGGAGSELALKVRGEEVGAAAGSKAAGLNQGESSGAGGRRRDPAL